MKLNPDSTTRISLALGATVLLAFGSAPALGADWPTFKPGQWSFERTMTGADAKDQKVATTECIDPTADQKKQQALLTSAGCKFTPLKSSGKTHRYSSDCKMGRVTSKSNSVLEVESAEAYTLTVDATVNGKKGREVLRARRTGDCPK
jgi:hypothetical protein